MLGKHGGGNWHIILVRDDDEKAATCMYVYYRYELGHEYIYQTKRTARVNGIRVTRGNYHLSIGN